MILDPVGPKAPTGVGWGVGWLGRFLLRGLPDTNPARDGSGPRAPPLSGSCRHPWCWRPPRPNLGGSAPRQRRSVSVSSEMWGDVLGIHIVPTRPSHVLHDLRLMVVGVGCQNRGTINLPPLRCCRKFLNNGPSIRGGSWCCHGGAKVSDGKVFENTCVGHYQLEPKFMAFAIVTQAYSRHKALHGCRLVQLAISYHHLCACVGAKLALSFAELSSILTTSQRQRACYVSYRRIPNKV